MHRAARDSSRLTSPGGALAQSCSLHDRTGIISRPTFAEVPDVLPLPTTRVMLFQSTGRCYNREGSERQIGVCGPIRRVEETTKNPCRFTWIALAVA